MEVLEHLEAQVVGLRDVDPVVKPEESVGVLGPATHAASTAPPATPTAPPAALTTPPAASEPPDSTPCALMLSTSTPTVRSPLVVPPPMITTPKSISSPTPESMSASEDTFSTSKVIAQARPPIGGLGGDNAMKAFAAGKDDPQAYLPDVLNQPEPTSLLQSLQAHTHQRSGLWSPFSTLSRLTLGATYRAVSTCGLRFVILSLSWWPNNHKTEDDTHTFQQAVSDVEWALL
ncbi:hypothetical protein BV22DRAFT_1134923 [Leucogyrophana mollusca]|uniref:Uncharacterized protein n=1 Tax=Leucogyrophana mollusca TaxID=85980 RepID=A0ACB8AX99_9AGAM|nr:hypothetical protein BV22DRAFT_1134923 [Leucogyrophana mollusca]